MTRVSRAALLAGAALPALGAAWLATASAGFLMGTGLWPTYPSPTGLDWTWAWASYARHMAEHPVVHRWLWISGAVAGLIPAAAAFRLGKFVSKAKPLHGESAWADTGEAKRNGMTISAVPPANGVIVGRTGTWPLRRYISLTTTEHVALYARTGSGKGVSFVMPNCLWWGGSLVAYDIKGELYRKTAARRRAMGQDVFFFAPTSPDGRTHRYNPFSVVPRGTVGCIDAIHKINHVLVPPNPKADNPFWDDSARSAINGISVLLAETPGAPLSIPAVRRLALRPDYRETIRDMIEKARAEGRPYLQSAVDDVLGWVNDPDDRTRSGVQRTITAHLALWASPTVAAAMETSDFDLRELRSTPMSIFLGIGAADTRRLRPVTQLLFQQIVSLHTQVEFRQDPAHRCEILMMLDEMWATGRMDVLADAAAFVRAYGIRMAYVLQAKSQLISLYGEEGAANLAENTGVEIFFGVKGLKMAREVSETAGFDTVQEMSQSRPRFMGWLNPSKQTESEAARRRALVLPQEVQRLSPDKQIVFRGRMQPLRTERVTYWRDPLFRELEQAPPEPPLLQVVVARDDDNAQREKARREGEALAAQHRREQQAAEQEEQQADLAVQAAGMAARDEAIRTAQAQVDAE